MRVCVCGWVCLDRVLGSSAGASMSGRRLADGASLWHRMHVPAKRAGVRRGSTTSPISAPDATSSGRLARAPMVQPAADGGLGGPSWSGFWSGVVWWLWAEGGPASHFLCVCRGWRAGTENVLEMIGLSVALESAYNNLEQNRKHLEATRSIIHEKLMYASGCAASELVRTSQALPVAICPQGPQTAPNIKGETPAHMLWRTASAVYGTARNPPWIPPPPPQLPVFELGLNPPPPLPMQLKTEICARGEAKCQMPAPRDMMPVGGAVPRWGHGYHERASHLSQLFGPAPFTNPPSMSGGFPPRTANKYAHPEAPTGILTQP